MNMHEVILILHILGATVWTGGHLILSLVVLPKVLKTMDHNLLIDFEQGFEKIGIPALIFQIVSGLWLASQVLPDISDWFDFDDKIANLILFKLALLITTAGFAIDAKLRLLSNFNADKIVPMA